MRKSGRAHREKVQERRSKRPKTNDQTLSERLGRNFGAWDKHDRL